MVCKIFKFLNYFFFFFFKKLNFKIIFFFFFFFISNIFIFTISDLHAYHLYDILYWTTRRVTGSIRCVLTHQKNSSWIVIWMPTGSQMKIVTKVMVGFFYCCHASHIPQTLCFYFTYSYNGKIVEINQFSWFPCPRAQNTQYWQTWFDFNK